MAGVDAGQENYRSRPRQGGSDILGMAEILYNTCMNNSDKFTLAGRKALVTGGSRGIGRAIAVALAQAGADVAIVGRDISSLEAAASAVAAAGRAGAPIVADLADAAAVDRIVPAASAELGGIDLLVHAAGATVRTASLEVSMADAQRIMQVNAFAGMQLAQHVARGLLARKAGGEMVFVCSLMSSRARPTVLAYTMSKTALVGLVRTLAAEWAGAGIRVNGIAPGYIRTDLTRPLYDDPVFNEWVVSRTPAGRWGEAEDIASATVFLACPAAGFVNGQVLYVDGGWTAAL